MWQLLNVTNLPHCYSSQLTTKTFKKNRHDFDKLTTMTDHKATSTVLISKNTHTETKVNEENISVFLQLFQSYYAASEE